MVEPSMLARMSLANDGTPPYFCGPPCDEGLHHIPIGFLFLTEIRREA
jgi:hypothetical protein